MIHPYTRGGSMTDRSPDPTRVEAAELDPGSEHYPDLLRVRAYWDGKRADRFAPS
jgi:hypothetical protein